MYRTAASACGRPTWKSCSSWSRSATRWKWSPRRPKRWPGFLERPPKRSPPRSELYGKPTAGYGYRDVLSASAGNRTIFVADSVPGHEGPGTLKEEETCYCCKLYYSPPAMGYLPPRLPFCC